MIDGRQFYTADPLLNRLFDVSADGRRVLLSAQEEDPILDVYNEQTFFIVWIPTESAQSQVLAIPHIDVHLATATFSAQSQDELYVWVFDTFGALSGNLYRFDIAMNTLFRLISIDPLYEPSFSPDGKWFSYYTEDKQVFLSLAELETEGCH
jgi:hypothetical protein